MKRSFALLVTLALALCGLLSLAGPEHAPSPSPVRLHGHAPAPVETFALAPAPVAEAEHAPVEAAVDATPASAPVGPPERDDLAGLIARLRGGERPPEGDADHDPDRRGLLAPGAPTVWLVGRDGARVPGYTQGERLLLDAEAETVSDRRGTLVGHLLDASPAAIVGFAYDWDDPAAVVEVDLYVDGFLATTVLARAPRADGGPGGFAAGALPALADGEAHTVQALARRAGETRTVELLESPRQVGGNRPARGRIDGVDHDAVWGAASDPDGGAPLVHVRFDGAPLAPSLAEGGAFRVALPPHDVQRVHDLQVLVEDAQLAGLRVEAGTVRLGPADAEEPENVPPRGHVAFVNATQLSGWAIDADRGDAPICVDVLIDGVPWRRLRADGSFPALVHQGIGPDHLWLIDVPPELQDGRTHVVSVFAVNEPEGPDPELGGSPVTFKSVANTAPTGFADVIDHERLAGWAYDADLRAGAVEVEVWIDGALWQVLQANQDRPDLVPVVCPESAHGWSVAAPEVLRDGQFHTVRVLARNHPPGPAYELSGSPRELGALRPYLGAHLEGAAPRGVRVVDVLTDGPAYRAGIQEGDLLLSLNGEPAPVDLEPFARWIQARVPGEAIAVVLERVEDGVPVRHEVYPVLGHAPR